jgi:protein tyrosine phosphatase (PTP) superfamily phosphohydrolase (DUF442 family)
MSAFAPPTINCLAFVAYSGARIVYDQYYVTGQPSTPAYAAIATAGITSVICVREPGEAHAPPPVPPPPPFDTNESSELARLGVTYQNIPIERTMTQTQFDAAATQAALAFINRLARGPALIHCSTGDRASSVFAVALILSGISNADAVDYATNSLLLANSSIIALVNGFTASQATLHQHRAGAARFLNPTGR